MGTAPLDPRSDTDASRTGERLDSWKEIAAYLSRSVRTLHRWEKDEGLPVRFVLIRRFDESLLRAVSRRKSPRGPGVASLLQPWILTAAWRFTR